MAASLGPVKWVKHIKIMVLFSPFLSKDCKNHLCLYHGLTCVQSGFVPIISSERGRGQQS